MTISLSNSTPLQYAGNGTAVTFSYPWKISAAAELVVGFIIGGVYTQQGPGLYTVAGVGNNGGGQITFTNAPPLGTTVDLRTLTPETQPTDFANLGAYLPENTTNAADRLTRMVQDLTRLIYTYGIHGPDTEFTPWPAIPGPATRANTALGFDQNGLPTVAALLPSALTQPQFNAFLASSPGFPTPATLAETNAGVAIINGNYPPGNMLRYGIVPNNQGAAAQNTTYLQALLNYNIANGPTGYFIFPNTTGNDTYFFGPTPMLVRGFCHLDLGGCTLNYSGQVPAGFGNSGLFVFVHDFTIENGTINTACDVSLASGSGCALFVGGRDITSLITVYDSLLPSGGSLGRGVIRNITAAMNNTNTTNSGSVGIGMLGGISNLIVENVTIDCQSTVAHGIQYEWGWATNQPTTSQRQTSHAKNMSFRNIRILNCGTQDSGTGSGIAIGGAYNCEVDGLYVQNAPGAFLFYVGDAMFYNPWAGVDQQGAKRNITLRNIVGGNISTTGINLTGKWTASATYLAATIAALGHPFDYAAQTDLMTFSLDGFSIGGACTGIQVSGECDIRNGLINSTGGSGSIILSDECVRFRFDNVTVRDNSVAMGIRGQFGDAIWSPARLKVGTISNCMISGNNATGIQIGNGEAVLIQNCRIGYNTIWDVANETVQTTGVQVVVGQGGSLASAGGVTCDNCFVTVAGGGTSYLISGTAALTNNLVFPRNALSGNINGWAINGVSQVTSTQLASAAAAVNVYDKFLGRTAYSSTVSKLFIAQGTSPTSTWVSADGGTTVTPS